MSFAPTSAIEKPYPKHPSVLLRASCRLCRMNVDLCLCAVTPRLTLKTRVVIFMHCKEFVLSSNTGVLANRVLANSRIVYRGHPDRRVVSRQDVAPDPERTYVLYPAPDAHILDERFVASLPGPITLICPDGHWGQTKKILKREDALKGLPCVKLPDGLISNYRLRRNPIAGRVCTYEAIAAALGVLEGAHVPEAMRGIFEKMVTRLLWMRRKIRSDEIVW